MILCGIKGGITKNRLASKGKPCILTESNSVAIGQTSDPSIPFDAWEKYCQGREGVHSFHSTIEVPQNPLVWMWSEDVDHLFLEAAQESDLVVHQRKDALIFGISTEKGFSRFKDRVLEKVQAGSGNQQLTKDDIGTAISLFGKEPSLIASWKLRKIF